MTKINRNDLCPCGSNKKYKKCCELREAEKKKKKALGLKGMNLKLKNPGAPMVSLANKVFSVLSSSIEQPVKNSITRHNITASSNAATHCHTDSCCCHPPGEERDQGQEVESRDVRGYRTLEELIGVEDTENHSEKI